VHNKSFTDEIQAKASASFKWSALGEGATRLSQPLLLLLLSRLLTPGDFGLVAVAIAVIGIAQVWQDFGLGKTLVQLENDFEAGANVVFWLNLFLSSAIYGGILLFAAPIAEVFRAPEAVPVIRLLTLRVVISGLTSVQQGILQRNLDYRTLFFSRVLAAGVPVVVSVPMAIMGCGVWSIVSGALLGSIAQSAFLWWRSSWRPLLGFDLEVASRLFKFSQWVFLEGLLTSVINWGDSVIVAHYLGPVKLGVYQLAMSLIRAAYGMVLSPTTPVAYSIFAKLRRMPVELFAAYLQTTSFLVMICSLGATMANIMAVPGMVWMLGPKWAGADEIAAILCLLVICDSAVCCLPNLMTAVGRPDVNFRALLVICAFSIPMFIVTAKMGLIAFAWSRLVLAFIDNLVILYMAARVIQFDWGSFLRMLFPPALSAASVIALFSMFESIWVPDSLLKLIVEATVGGILFLGGVWVLDRKALARAWEHAGNIIGLRSRAVAKDWTVKTDSGG